MSLLTALGYYLGGRGQARQAESEMQNRAELTALEKQRVAQEAENGSGSRSRVPCAAVGAHAAQPGVDPATGQPIAARHRAAARPKFNGTCANASTRPNRDSAAAGRRPPSPRPGCGGRGRARRCARVARAGRRVGSRHVPQRASGEITEGKIPLDQAAGGASASRSHMVQPASRRRTAEDCSHAPGQVDARACDD